MALDMSQITVAAFLKRANKGASAKRCLFGPVNHEENARFLREQLALQERESKAKWNFDFRTETPVGGKFQWEQVSDENQVPVAYSMPQITKKTPCKSRVCRPLSFSSRVNLNAKLNSTDILKKDNVVTLDNSSPAAERKSVTTVQQVNFVRDETPGLFKPIEKCLTSSQEDNTTTSSTSSPQSSLSSHLSSRALKRKVNQTDITEFFQVKKSRNLLAAGSAKRRLDL